MEMSISDVQLLNNVLAEKYFFYSVYLSLP